MTQDNIIAACKESAKFSFSPKFTLFGVSAMGEYTLITNVGTAEAIAERFRDEAMIGDHAGLEIRCDGIRVDLS